MTGHDGTDNLEELLQKTRVLAVDTLAAVEAWLCGARDPGEPEFLPVGDATMAQLDDYIAEKLDGLSGVRLFDATRDIGLASETRRALRDGLALRDGHKRRMFKCAANLHDRLAAASGQGR